MSTISLRTYIKEIDSLIEQGRLDEAIFHSRHILTKYPKHIETYLLLGKAYLENNQNSNAADIFQRVLSAVPDDFISHVGMSVIREEEGNLPAAVLHMEKAFERQPYNSEIQLELRRLYGKRDGMEPTKVRLTQGALARMFIRGDLLNQGIAELRTAISENPDRYDLKTLLAETFHLNGQLANAIDLASDILKKYPFNLVANRIMARSLKTHDHPQEMAICTKRLYALSPYEAYISEHAPAEEQVPDRAITIDQIEWNEGQQSLRTKTRESSTPWSETQGRFELSRARNDNQIIPAWLDPQNQEKETAMPEDINGNPTPQDQNDKSSQDNQDKNIPDWMKDAGWDESSGTFDESKPVFDDLEDEDDILPGEIPAWLEDAAPEGFSFNDDSSLPGEDVDSARPLIDDDLIPLTPEDDFQAELPEQKPAPSEIIPDDPGEEDLDIPSWLKDLKLDEDSQETAIAWLENMPESLRVTEEDLESVLPEEPADIEQPADDLAWMDELHDREEESAAEDETRESLAALSEDLVASDLIPEEGAEDKLFATEELRSYNDASPPWLKELGDDQEQPSTGKVPDEPGTADYTSAREAIFGSEPAPEETAKDHSLMPDWLAELEPDESPPAEEPAAPSRESSISDRDLPDWLEDFESSAKSAKSAETADGSESASLDWLQSLADEVETSGEDLIAVTPEPDDSVQPGPTPGADELDSSEIEVSPEDDTLNTAIPDWLSKIGEAEYEEKIQERADKSDFEEPLTWLEQLEDQDQDLADQEKSAKDSAVLDWLEGRDTDATESESEVDLREMLEEGPPEMAPYQELETAKYMPPPEKAPTDLPDWLAELDETQQQDQPSLEDAIRRSGHPLSDDEQEFLDLSKETRTDNADWLAKLDLEEDQPSPETDIPAIREEYPEESEKEDTYQEVSISGGILDRLKDTGAINQEDEPEVPQWLENLKKEEDPQETAILWLKQFVEQGDQADLNHEIKRYTDELDPSDSIPKWMEDLKNEEDPQTTAMLWLKKLSKDREPAPTTRSQSKEEDESGWLAALEKEMAEKAQPAKAQSEKDFLDNSEGWLADLEVDEKLKSEKEELPDWSQAGEEAQPAANDGETPPWMKATSPLEGDFYTDELAGNKEKEVEIPAWLAGYGDGEESVAEQASSPPDIEPSPTEIEPEKDEYAWVSAKEDAPPRPTREPIDLNKAAISQLESILGISYQVAKGIVSYREKHGPYKDITDLMNVPEISDEQTIEILKPEVVIREVKTQPTPPPAAKAPKFDPKQALKNARDLIANSEILEGLEIYETLIKKRKSLDIIIDDLNQAASDHPLDIGIMKTLGDAYMRSDLLDKALEAYSKAEDLLR